MSVYEYVYAKGRERDGKGGRRESDYFFLGIFMTLMFNVQCSLMSRCLASALVNLSSFTDSFFVGGVDKRIHFQALMQVNQVHFRILALNFDKRTMN